jgi:hypothetical protein
MLKAFRVSDVAAGRRQPKSKCERILTPPSAHKYASSLLATGVGRSLRCLTR